MDQEVMINALANGEIALEAIEKASTTTGPKCVPDSSLMIACAFSSGMAFL